MIVYQESYDVHRTLERRLFLNGKTYVEINPYSEEGGTDFEDEKNSLGLQLCRDYRHYPETPPDFFDEAGMGLRYGMVINWVTFLYGGCPVEWVVQELYEMEQNWLVREGAKPLSPAQEIPELPNVCYRVSYHHDGLVEETYFHPYRKLGSWIPGVAEFISAQSDTTDRKK